MDKELNIRLPKNHIVIDFDIKEASNLPSLPSTYAEINRSGTGMHLHYIYSGDSKEDK